MSLLSELRMLTGKTERMAENARKRGRAKPRMGKLPAKKAVSAACDTCGKAAGRNTHLCSPPSPGKARACEFCGLEHTDPYHVCKTMAEGVKYFCGNCGRLSPSRANLCRPKKII